MGSREYLRGEQVRTEASEKKRKKRRTSSGAQWVHAQRATSPRAARGFPGQRAAAVGWAGVGPTRLAPTATELHVPRH